MKSRIIVTGVTGMLGSKVYEVGQELGYDVYGTTRRDLSEEHFPASTFPRDRIVRMDATKQDIARVLDAIKPQTVINCLGVIKQVTQEPNALYRINRDFAHDLAEECTLRSIRLVEVSTDCVFSGKKGNYSENDVPDPIDEYGRSKLAGEIYAAPHVTIRTSIIGIERDTSKSLISWFLSNPPGSTVKGYTRAIWSGLTTRALAPILYDFAAGPRRDVTGLLHIAGDPISKHDLLLLCKKYLHHDVSIIEESSFFSDRSLNHRKMDSLGITAPSVENMVQEMAERDYLSQSRR